jgi:hypothetical protein
MNVYVCTKTHAAPVYAQVAKDRNHWQLFEDGVKVASGDPLVAVERVFESRVQVNHLRCLPTLLVRVLVGSVGKSRLFFHVKNMLRMAFGTFPTFCHTHATADDGL